MKQMTDQQAMHIMAQENMDIKVFNTINGGQLVNRGKAAELKILINPGDFQEYASAATMGTPYNYAWALYKVNFKQLTEIKKTRQPDDSELYLNRIQETRDYLMQLEPKHTNVEKLIGDILVCLGYESNGLNFKP